MKKALVLWVVLEWVSNCHGYSAGPPAGTCASMTPNHDTSAQMSAAPYTITTSSAAYQKHENVTVTITATSPGSSPFRGFFIQARSSGSSNPVGRFYLKGTDSEVKLMTCTGGSQSDNAISHASNVDKTTKEFLWYNPDGGDVTFQGTFVKVKATYWTGVQSAALTETVTTTITVPNTNLGGGATSLVYSSIWVLCGFVILVQISL